MAEIQLLEIKYIYICVCLVPIKTCHFMGLVWDGIGTFDQEEANIFIVRG